MQGNKAASTPSQADFVGTLALLLMAFAIVASLLVLIAAANAG